LFTYKAQTFINYTVKIVYTTLVVYWTSNEYSVYKNNLNRRHDRNRHIAVNNILQKLFGKWWVGI